MTAVGLTTGFRAQKSRLPPRLDRPRAARFVELPVIAILTFAVGLVTLHCAIVSALADWPAACRSLSTAFHGAIRGARGGLLKKEGSARVIPDNTNNLVGL